MDWHDDMLKQFKGNHLDQNCMISSKRKVLPLKISLYFFGTENVLKNSSSVFFCQVLLSNCFNFHVSVPSLEVGDLSLEIHFIKAQPLVHRKISLTSMYRLFPTHACFVYKLFKGMLSFFIFQQ